MTTAINKQQKVIAVLATSTAISAGVETRRRSKQEVELRPTARAQEMGNTGGAKSPADVQGGDSTWLDQCDAN